MAKQERQFLDELPDGIELSRRRWYERLVEDLVTHPLKWTIVTVDGATVAGGKASNLCSTIRNRSVVAFTADDVPEGDFEAERVHVSSGDSGPAYEVYARFVPYTVERHEDAADGK